MSSIFNRDVECNHGFSRAGLPDELFVAPDTAAEMAEAFGYGNPPTDEEVDAMYADWQARQSYTMGGQGHDPRPTSPAGAMFPEVPTWSDEQLVTAIDLCERRHPGLNLHAVGNRPDRHEAFLDACSAELVRRLEARGVRFAA
jgi:hypothetical protein